MSNSRRRHFHHEMIQKPGRRLMLHVPLNFVQRRISGGHGRSTNAALNLTAFIDFLITTVVFLLMSFSASGEIPVDKNTKLPSAENTIDMVDAPMIAIVGNMITVDNVAAGSTRPIEEAGRLTKVDELQAVLKNKREAWKQINPKKPFPGVVIMQVDKRVSALVVKSVFQTAAGAGYPNVSFMVGQIPRKNAGGAAHH